MSMTATAQKFFEACEAGKGWQACQAYCTPDATFAAQAEPLAEVKTLAAYADWMKGMCTVFPDASYDLKSFAADSARHNVTAYAVFFASHTGPGGPVAPSGKAMQTDYVYVMQFADGKIAHMTKIWHAGIALKQVGWA